MLQKGLEFPIVFIVGMEEGLFHTQDLSGKKNKWKKKEDFCYVGITRAKESLYLTYASKRTIYGETSSNAVSRFIVDIPERLLDGEIRLKNFDDDSQITDDDLNFDNILDKYLK